MAAERPNRSRRPRPRASAERGLAARVAALEERVARLESGKAPKGDGRSAAVRRPKTVERCPGCGLPLRRRAGRCAACGRPLDSL